MSLSSNTVNYIDLSGEYIQGTCELTRESAPQQDCKHDWYFSFGLQAQVYGNRSALSFCYAHSIINKTDSNTCNKFLLLETLNFCV